VTYSGGASNPKRLVQQGRRRHDPVAVEHNHDRVRTGLAIVDDQPQVVSVCRLTSAATSSAI
jgi:hypothetical protein